MNIREENDFLFDQWLEEREDRGELNQEQIETMRSCRQQSIEMPEERGTVVNRPPETGINQLKPEEYEQK